MHKLFKKGISVIVAAGLFIIPACFPVDETQGPRTINPSSTAEPASATPESQNNNQEVSPSETPKAQSSATPQPSDEDPQSIEIITNDEELEAYFDSITDEEIEELFKIIEDIDISPEIGVDNDPGFEDIIIP